MSEKEIVLTPEDEAMIPDWVANWTEVGLSTDPANRPEAEEGVRMAYERAGLEPPNLIVWADSPLAGARIAALLESGTYDLDGDLHEQSLSMSPKEVRRQLSQSLWGQHSAGWLAWATFFQDVHPVEGVDVRGLAQVARNAGWWWVFDEAAVLTERPTELYRDDWGRLHNTEGPAIRYPDGFSVFSVGGVRIPDWIILNPDKITPEMCDSEENLEVRRVMIDQMGPGKFMDARDGKKVQADDFGELWRVSSYYETGEDLVMVKVVNATPEPDGSFKDYWLQVPPTMRTAKEAVAWTFDVPTEAYSPTIES